MFAHFLTAFFLLGITEMTIPEKEKRKKEKKQKKKHGCCAYGFTFYQLIWCKSTFKSFEGTECHKK